jgi:hypothetical protein
MEPRLPKPQQCSRQALDKKKKPSIENFAYPGYFGLCQLQVLNEVN